EEDCAAIGAAVVGDEGSGR
ncbi:hypothetical protein A2U01_0082425, partial [Trifolium medium]|nr:hypothetical protein [Trifolium medium]